jgi:hypothetical protein
MLQHASVDGELQSDVEALEALLLARPWKGGLIGRGACTFCAWCGVRTVLHNPGDREAYPFFNLPLLVPKAAWVASIHGLVGWLVIDQAACGHPPFGSMTCSEICKCL